MLPNFPISIGDYFPVGVLALPRELLHFELSPETLARDTFLLNAASVSALTWVAYDMILNFNREVNLVWRRWREPRGRHSRRLYVIVRYFSVAALASFVGVNTSVGLSLDFCRVWYYIVLVNTTIITLLPDIMLLIRVNAVYSWNFRTLLFTIFLFMTQMTTSLVAGVLAVTSAQFPSHTSFPVSGCPVALSPSVARFTLVAWIPSILAQATYLGLTLNTLAHLIRSLDVGAPPPLARLSNSGVSPPAPVPVPPVTLSRGRSSLPSPSISYAPSPSRPTRILTSTPPRASSLPVLRVPQSSPLASTSTLFSPPHLPALQESAATLVTSSPAQPDHFAVTSDSNILNHVSNMSSGLGRTGSRASGSGTAGVRAGDVRSGGAGEPSGPLASTPSTSRSPDASTPPTQELPASRNTGMEKQENFHHGIQRSRTISIQAREPSSIHPQLHQEDRKTWSKGPWHGTGGRWKYYRYTPSLFSLFSWTALKQVQRLVPTMMVFVGHGGWYFVLAILAKVANAVMVTTFSGPLQAFAIPFMMALYPVLVSRIYLSMVHYLHFGLPMKNPRLLASYEGENYASGYRGDTSTYGMDEDDDMVDDFEDCEEDYTSFRRGDTEAEGRFTPGILKFSLGASRSARGPGAQSSSSNGKGRGQGRGTRGRGYDESGRRYKPRGPRLGRITFAARESLANSSVLDLGFGNEEF